MLAGLARGIASEVGECTALGSLAEVVRSRCCRPPVGQHCTSCFRDAGSAVADRMCND
jgi:hypothetical protein